MMHTLFIAVPIVELVLVAALLMRVAIGPSVSDRIVALNTISTLVAVAILFFAAYADRVSYLDVALWLSSFSYLGAFVWARYLERGLL
jgi:multicomponent Na+:H+ antiporter subunit F